jgi:molecular chaperone GrpE
VEFPEAGPEADREDAGTAPLGTGAGAGAERPDSGTAGGDGGSVETLRRERDDLRERLLRSLADFENYRKRSRREQEETARRATDSLLLEMLEVLDDFERGFAHAAEAGSTGGLGEGMEITLRSFRDLLARRGVREMEALGEAFDPNRHEAVMEEKAAGAASGSVTRVLRKGYLQGDRVLRPARVAVAH